MNIWKKGHIFLNDLFMSEHGHEAYVGNREGPRLYVRDQKEDIDFLRGLKTQFLVISITATNLYKYFLPFRYIRCGSLVNW